MNELKPAGNWRPIQLWFVQEGSTERYVALDERAARVFADVTHRHSIDSTAGPIHVVPRTAWLEDS